MRALIQHNISSGLGDTIVAIFEYLNTAENLTNKGYVVDLKINSIRNIYFELNAFFDVFNKENYNIFNSIEFINEPIHDEKFDVFERVYTLSGVKPGAHWWDLFLEKNYDNSILSNIEIYPYQCTTFPKYKTIFTEKIMEEYFNEINGELKTNEYVSIYFRTNDLEDNIQFFESQKDKVINIINNNQKIFICSNSYRFKKWVKELNNRNIFMFDIPGESEFGNHYNLDLQHKLDMGLVLDGINTKKIRTKYTIYDILSLGFSSEINHFSSWGRTSNFTFLGKLRGVKNNLYI